MWEAGPNHRGFAGRFIQLLKMRTAILVSSHLILLMTSLCLLSSETLPTPPLGDAKARNYSFNEAVY